MPVNYLVEIQTTSSNTLIKIRHCEFAHDHSILCECRQRIINYTVAISNTQQINKFGILFRYEQNAHTKGFNYRLVCSLCKSAVRVIFIASAAATLELQEENPFILNVE